MATKSILTKSSITFLEKYLNNPSPTGYEAGGQKIWMDYLQPYVDTFITDTYGSAVGVINPEAKFRVVIEGHSDEISWYVNYITDNGLIYVIRNGGSDHQIAPSKRVNILTKKGIVKGVFGWPAIHTRNRGKEEAATLHNIFIDCGCSTKEEVEKLGVNVGCVITYPDEFMILNENKFVCRAIDNRMGGFMIAEVARLLKENKKQLPFGLYIVNAVQEEIGLRGAEMITQTIKPNVAIITDVWIFTAFGAALIILGTVLYRSRAVWSGLSIIIAGFTVFEYWASPSFFSGASSEFHAVLVSKTVLTIVALVALYAVWRIMRTGREA